VSGGVKVVGILLKFSTCFDLVSDENHEIFLYILIDFNSFFVGSLRFFLIIKILACSDEVMNILNYH